MYGFNFKTKRKVACWCVVNMSEIGGAVHTIDGVMWNIGGLISIHSVFVDNRAVTRSEGAGWGVPLAAQSAPCARAPRTLMHVASRCTRRATSRSRLRASPSSDTTLDANHSYLPQNVVKQQPLHSSWQISLRSTVPVMFTTMQFTANNRYCTLIDYYCIVYVPLACASVCATRIHVSYACPVSHMISQCIGSDTLVCLFTLETLHIASLTSSRHNVPNIFKYFIYS